MIQSIFVCLTSYQYVLSDIIAIQNYKKNGNRSLIILKYVSGINPKNNVYADYVLIFRSLIGKLKVIWNAFKIGLDWKTKELYFFNDREPITKNIAKWCKRKILVEEGLGTYFSSANLKPIGDLIVPDVALVGYPVIYKETHENTTRLEKLEYKKIFSIDSVSRVNSINSINADNNNANDRSYVDILFLAQATRDNENIREIELNFIKYLIHFYPHLSIAIKPHPRDNFPKKYRIDDTIKILNGTMPIESIIFLLKISSVFTPYSSGGVTLANMFESLRVVYVYKLLGINLDEKVEKFLNDVKNIYIPNSYNEIAEILKTMGKTK